MTKTPEQLQKELYEACFNVTLQGITQPNPNSSPSEEAVQDYKNADQHITKKAAEEERKRKEWRESTAAHTNSDSLHTKQKTENSSLAAQDPQGAASIRIAEQNKGKVSTQPIVIADTMTKALLNVAGIDTADSTNLALLMPVKKLISLIMENDLALASGKDEERKKAIKEIQNAIKKLSDKISETISPEQQQAMGTSLAAVGKELLSSAAAEYHGRYVALRNNNPNNLFLEPIEGFLSRAHHMGLALGKVAENIRNNLEENNQKGFRQ